MHGESGGGGGGGGGKELGIRLVGISPVSILLTVLLDACDISLYHQCQSR